MAEEENNKIEENLKELDEKDLQEVEEQEAEALAEGEAEASYESQLGGNIFLRQMMDQNFIEYASYVIKERAIPDVDDGLKPVQRRILWSLFQVDDGKFHKVANIIGHTMQYHPHGDASIGDALVVLANKEFFIDKQGNFGNLYTGDSASAARYIECRLSHLGREVLYNNDITEFVDSYDGRNKEPVVLPVKIPSLLMLGAEGIAVGMSTKILPHNFVELLQAQIAVLDGEDFEIYPDFQQGGRMDVSEYEEGNGKIKLRAKIERDGRRLVIREIPATTTTESLIASIERAVEKNKIKVASINDYTGEQVEIEIIPTRGQDPDKALKALYTYTDCSVSVSVNMMVICENRPAQMDVSSVIRRNTDKLLEYLKWELEIELNKLQELFHSKTLAQIFIENRIYKRIEECDSFDLVVQEIYKGFEPFKDRLNREITDEDINKLLAIPIRRISLFDIRKNQEELDDILKQIEQINKDLKRLKSYAKKYLQALIDKYGHLYPRRTEIDEFKKIDRRAVALNNIKVGWDRKNCYIGTNVKSDDSVTCNEFDHLLCVERKGNYKVINIPDKVFIGRLYDFRKYDPNIEFGVIYSEAKTGKLYAKRTVIDKFITDREYTLCPKGCRLELLTPRSDAIYELVEETKRGANNVSEINLQDFPVRSPKARGLLLSSKPVLKLTHLRYLTEEELGSTEEIVDTSAEEDFEIPANQEPEEETVKTESQADTEPVSQEEPGKAAKEEKPKDSQLSKQEKTEKKTPEESDKEETEVTTEAGNGQPDIEKPVKKSSKKEDKPNRPEKPEKPEKPQPESAKAEDPAIPEEPEKQEIEQQTQKQEAPVVEEKQELGVSDQKGPESIPAEDASPDNNDEATAESKDKSKDDSWGIIQPEFGF
jgi:topoisomerase-4 subunit A